MCLIIMNGTRIYSYSFCFMEPNINVCFKDVKICKKDIEVGLVCVNIIKLVIELLKTVYYSQAFNFHDNDPFTNNVCNAYICM